MRSELTPLRSKIEEDEKPHAYLDKVSPEQTRNNSIGIARMGLGETKRRLAEISDPGKFERLANSVLREAEPGCRGLVASGLNELGRPIAEPVDGIVFVQGSEPPHVIVVQHTTCKRKDLRGKWLRDRNESESPSDCKMAAKVGDLIKAAKVVDCLRQELPGLRATLILATNQEPNLKLVGDAEVAGRQKGLEIGIWSRSRLAAFLDQNPEGQWIRSRYLGIIQDRLSRDLLKELSRMSLQNGGLLDDSSLRIERQLDRTLKGVSGNVVLVTGEPGMGKSVACHKHLQAHIKAGGHGLVIRHTTVAKAQSLEQAIDKTLRDLHAPLGEGAGSEALALASAHMPFFMVVEDIHGSSQQTALLEKLINWSPQREDSENRRHWQLFCPVRPKALDLLRDQIRKKAIRLVIKASNFTADEGASAVKLRWKSSGVVKSRLEAKEISTALGHDPLLIALQDPTESMDLDSPIRAFIDSSLRRLKANLQGFTVAEYWQGLRAFAVKMIELRSLNVALSTTASWFGAERTTVAILRDLIHNGEVIRLTAPAKDEHITFRHDRVRDWLLAHAASDLIRIGSMPEDVLADPYFAEIIGESLVCKGIPASAIEKVKKASPLALFYAMRHFDWPSNDIHNAILTAAEAWLDEDTTHSVSKSDMLLDASMVLSGIEAEYVIPLANRFRREYNSWPALCARFRNGDLAAGISMCCHFEPGIQVAGHLELIDHVRRHRGEWLITELIQILRGEPSNATRSGALRLAGHVGDSGLSCAVAESWNNDPGRESRLAEYLWASTQCSGHGAIGSLASVCDSWAELPEESEQGDSRPSRNSLATNSLRWAFEARLPEPAIHFFIERAKSLDLNWPITFLLHGIDHPDAVEFIARELFSRYDGHHPFRGSVIMGWHRKQEKTGYSMSSASRVRLQGLWADTENETELRKVAFSLWSPTVAKGDVSLLRTIATDDELVDEALFQRIRRGDIEATPILVDKLRQDTRGHWWHAARQVWSDELTGCLESVLAQLSDQLGSAGDPTITHHYQRALAVCLIELPTGISERLLRKYWDHLQFSSHFVQAALYLATPGSKSLASKAIDESPDPEILLEQVSQLFGSMVENLPGITRIEQMQALQPYFDYIDDGDLRMLWQECNRQGWYEFRRRNLDNFVESDYTDEKRAIERLDRELGQGAGSFIHVWVERYLNTGVSIEHVMKTVAGWLSSQTDVSALQLAARIVVSFGRRRDLSVLFKYCACAADLPKAIIENARFAQMRRTLK